MGSANSWEFWELLQSSASINLIIEQSCEYELGRCVEWVTYRCNGIFLVLLCFVLGGCGVLYIYEYINVMCNSIVYLLVIVKAIILLLFYVKLV